MSKPFVYEGSLDIYENDGYIILTDTEELGKLIAVHFNPASTGIYPSATLPHIRLTIEVINDLLAAEADISNRKNGI